MSCADLSSPTADPQHAQHGGHEDRREHFHGRVLLADDDTMHLLVTSSSLKAYDCKTVTNGLDAIVRIFSCCASNTPGWEEHEGDSIDAVVLGCSMPHMSGAEVALLVRSMAHWHPYAQMLPILGAMPPSVDSEAQCLSAGMNGCIAKPFAKDACVSSVSEMVAHARSQQGQPLYT